MGIMPEYFILWQGLFLKFQQLWTSCLETDRTRVLKDNLNHDSLPRIVVVKFQKDKSHIIYLFFENITFEPFLSNPQNRTETLFYAKDHNIAFQMDW